MEFFEESNQNKYIILTAEDILELRKKVNNNSILQLQSKIKIPPDLIPPSSQEELLLFRYQHEKIYEICRAFKFPSTLRATAHWYLNRYSLRHSVLDYDLKHVMVMCILLASKSENMHLSNEQFIGKLPNVNSELIVQLEFVILSALEYRVFYFHPENALIGILTLYKAWRDGAHWNEQIVTNCKLFLDRCYRTDAILFYRPSLLATLTLFLVSERDPIIHEFLTYLLPLTKVNVSLERFEALADDLQRLLENDRVDQASLKDIDRRVIQIRKLIQSGV